MSKFFIISPDGFPLHPDPIECKESEIEATAHREADKIIKRYEQQGHYTTAKQIRIPYENIKANCELQFID